MMKKYVFSFNFYHQVMFFNKKSVNALNLIDRYFSSIDYIRDAQPSEYKGPKKWKRIMSRAKTACEC